MTGFSIKGKMLVQPD